MIITVFFLPPAVPTSNYRVDKIYNVGTNFCLERGSTDRVQIRCDVVPRDSPLSIQVPGPSRTWTMNNTEIYSVPHIGTSTSSFLNQDFFEDSILKYGSTYPSALELHSDGSILMNFDAKPRRPGLTLGSGDEGDDVFNALLGKWTCLLASDLQTISATTVVSEC